MKTLDQTLMDQRVERLLAEVEEARTTAQYWKAEHLAGNAEIERLRAELDAARRTAEYWKAEHLAGNAELAETQSFLHLTQDENERLRAELVRKDRLFDMLLIAADDSDNAFYGTLATHFVRAIAQQGIDAPKAQEPYGCDAPKAEEPK